MIYEIAMWAAVIGATGLLIFHEEILRWLAKWFEDR